MILVLAEPGDPVAAWVAAGLAGRGRPVLAVGADDLAAATTWVHAVDTASSRLRATWTDGRRLDSAEVVATFNRLVAEPRPPAGVAPADRGYAAEELRAFTLGWLASLPGPVLNRATPEGWSGAAPHPAAVHVRAATAGLPVDDLDDAVAPAVGPARPVQRALVVAGHVLGPPLARRHADGCHALAAALGLGVAGVDFVPSAAGDGRWVVDRVDPRPDLRRGGVAALDALDRALAGVAA